MKAQGKVRGILIEGNDGHEYLPGPNLIGPGMGEDFFLWMALREAFKAFPPIPTWPTWPA